VNAYDLGARDADEVGIAYLLPLFDCDTEAARADSNIRQLRLSALAPGVSQTTRRDIEDLATAWTGFRHSHVGILGCFGPRDAAALKEYVARTDLLLASVIRDAGTAPGSLSSARPPIPAPAPAASPTSPAASSPRSASRWWLLAAGSVVGGLIFHARSRQ